MYRSRLAARAAVERHVGIITRFWTQVHCPLDADQCWNWKGPLDRGAEPVLNFPGGSVSAARLAWYVVLDEFPLAGHTDRRCSNDRCVRPTHIRWRVSARARAWMVAVDEGYLGYAGNPTVAHEREAALLAGAVADEGPDRVAS
jgi:hypothetical protein